MRFQYLIRIVLALAVISVIAIYSNDKVPLLSASAVADTTTGLVSNWKFNEGTEIRPIRHWSKEAIIGYILVIFLTNFIVNLTLLRTRNPVVKNLKLLKKSLSKLTLVIIQSDSGFKHHLLANFSEDIHAILDNFPEIYGRNTIPLAW